MPKRETVKLNNDNIKLQIKKTFRHNIAFCEAMGRHATWVTDWCRAVPKNLPSPEEAAKMCELLSVQPEEIIADPADVEKVRALMEKNAPPELSPLKKEVLDIIDGMTEKQLIRLLNILQISKEIFGKDED